MNASQWPARVLHVAALPFPTYQGTQAAISSMLCASRAFGVDAQLFSYAARAYEHEPARFPLHRLRDRSGLGSLRSGPSLSKLWLDLRMLMQLRQLRAQFTPDVIVAHHIEAAALALATRDEPVVFFAHTDLQSELPVYGPSFLGPSLGYAGHAIDRSLARRANATAVVSKALQPYFAKQVSARGDMPSYVPTPWQLPHPISSSERDDARRSLSFESRHIVALYAGNLDAYQGVDNLLLATQLALTTLPELRLLIATESDASGLMRAAARLGLGCALRVSKLHGTALRRQLHAAADFVVVPRLAPGGLPIKLLDGLARGLACATVPAACAGLTLVECVELARTDQPTDLANAMLLLAQNSTRRHELGLLGRDYIAQEHSLLRFHNALQSVCELARAHYDRG